MEVERWYPPDGDEAIYHLSFWNRGVMMTLDLEDFDELLLLACRLTHGQQYAAGVKGVESDDNK